MPTWRTKLFLPTKHGTVETDDIFFRRGIFQGDSLSPLLFCLALAPISAMLVRANLGYRIKKKIVSNLLYIDDLKVYARSDTEMQQCKELIEGFSKDVSMEFGLSKCAVIHTRKGKVVKSNVVTDIPILDENGETTGYKYLGVLQAERVHHQRVREKATNEYKKRVRKVLESNLTARNTVQALNGFALPILRYSFGVCEWRSKDLAQVDRKTRKILTATGFHHPKSSLHNLYLHRRMGGRGLISAKDCHRQECTNLGKYIRTNPNKDPLVDIIKKDQERRKLGLLAYTRQPKKGTRQEIDQGHFDNLRKKPLHGQWFKSRENLPIVDIPQSNRWLQHAHLYYETESLLCAAQEQTLATNHLRAKVWGQQVDSKCRLCHEHEENIHHIVAGCKCLAGTKYLLRHNTVCKYLHWWICKDRGMTVPAEWYKHNPQPSTDVRDITIIWDMQVRTDAHTRYNKPDIIVHDKASRTCQIIDVAIPLDQNVNNKSAEKLTKYKELMQEYKRMHQVKEAEILPIIIGALGTINTECKEYTRKVSPNANLDIMVKSALLGTAHILRNFLA